jgi:hypothetical protein
VHDEVVDRHLDRLAGLERLDVRDEELVVESSRMVEVVLPQLLLAAPLDVLVVAVVSQEGDAVGTHAAQDLLGHRGLSGARSAGHPQSYVRHLPRIPKQY